MFNNQEANLYINRKKNRKEILINIIMAKSFVKCSKKLKYQQHYINRNIITTFATGNNDIR